jgi:YVTN family beta-propeller protein
VDVVTVGGVTKAFVANEDDGTVSVVDVRGRTVLATVQVGGRPTELVAAPDGSRIFVLNEDTGSVVVLDAGSHQQLATIALGSSLTGLDVSPDSRSLYVTANQPTHNLWRIDLATNQIANDVDVGDGALAVAAGRDMGRIFLTTAGNRLLLWDTGVNRATATLDVGRRPEDIAVAVAGPAASPSPVVPAGSPAPAVATLSPTTAPPLAPAGGEPTPTLPTPPSPGATVAPTPQASPTP